MYIISIIIAIKIDHQIFTFSLVFSLSQVHVFTMIVKSNPISYQSHRKATSLPNT